MAKRSHAERVPLKDRADPPGWVLDRLSGAQERKLVPKSKWFVMLDHVDLTPVERCVLDRLWFRCGGRKAHDETTYQGTISAGELAGYLGVSEVSIRAALTRAEEVGLIDVERRRAGLRNLPNRYTLCWPLRQPGAKPTRVDRVAAHAGLCLAPTKAGALCHRKAGSRTDHPGEGPCYQHEPKAEDVGQRSTQGGSTVDPSGGSTVYGGWVNGLAPSGVGVSRSDGKSAAADAAGGSDGALKGLYVIEGEAS